VKPKSRCDRYVKSIILKQNLQGKSSQLYNDGFQPDIISEIIAGHLAGSSLFRIFWMEIFYFLAGTAVTSNSSLAGGKKNRIRKLNQRNL